MRSVRLSLFALCATALVVSPAFSQPPGGGRGMMQFGRAMGAAQLLANASVQEELKLTDEQKEKVKDFAAKQREAMAGLRDLSPEERREKMQEMTKANAEAAEKFAKDVLKPDQAKRLKQITVQQAGVAAFAMEDVRKQLKITDEQADKFKTMAEDLQRDIRELFSGGGFDREAMQENMQKMRSLSKEYLTKAVGSLTDEQKKTWTEMTGKPFEVKMEQPRRDR
jgi:Spy/CpxP family protein refolding chaperone